MFRSMPLLAVLALLCDAGQVSAEPISGEIRSWHASSGVPPWDASIPPESRFAITNNGVSVALQSPHYLEINDPGGSVEANVRRKGSIAPIPETDPWAYQVELRMISHQRPDVDFGAHAGIQDQSRSGALTFAKDWVGFWEAQSYPLDTTDDFHAYRVIKDPQTGLVRLFVDTFDTAVLTVAYDELQSSSFTQVLLAGTSNPGRANFYVRSFAFNRNGTAIPEPSTLALMAMAALGLLVCAWRKNRR